MSQRLHINGVAHDRNFVALAAKWGLAPLLAGRLSSHLMPSLGVKGKNPP